MVGEVEDRLRGKLVQQLKGFEIKGYVYVIGGAAINVIWVGLILLARQNIAYSPPSS